MRTATSRVTEGIEVAVAHIDPVDIVLVVKISVVVAVVGRGGIILIAFGPGIGELAGGVDLAGEHVSEHLSADIAQLAHQNDGVDALYGQDLAHVDHAAQIQHQHQLFVEAGQEPELLQFFLVEQVVAPLVPAVGTLARGAGDHIHGQISFRSPKVLLGDLCRSDDLERMREAHDEFTGVRAFRFLGDPCRVVDLRLLVSRVLAVQPGLGRDGEAGFLQAPLDVHVAAGVHVARTGAAADGLPRAAAEERQLSLSLQGQGAVVFQQYHAFARQRTGQGHMVDLSRGDVRISGRVYLVCHSVFSSRNGHSSEMIRHICTI